MSIRSALIGVTSLLLLVGIGVLAYIGSRQIQKSVVDEALSRVDSDLSTAAALYEKEMRLDAERLRFIGDDGSRLCDPGTDPIQLRRLREQLGFAVLNCVGPMGEPLVVSSALEAERIPVERDPVLRRALAGQLAWGTLRFDRERLRAEGGAALASSQIVPPPEDDPNGGTDEALMRWFATPMRDSAGRTFAVLYGGQPVNHDHATVDAFVEVLYGTELYDGKPIGTVTFFLGDTRVATNVRGTNDRRSVGSRVSDVVRRRVLEEGRRWRDRAWVVDAWYISGYEPLRDPDGETVGMLYVGLLEAPYRAMRTRMLMGLALPAAALLAVALAATVWMVRRITRPLETLKTSATRIERGHWDAPVETGDTYREIIDLADAVHRMQGAIQRRDAELRAANAELVATNEALARVNANYMSTLGFVTHELKGPLANIQSLSSLIIDGYLGEVSAKALDTLTRVRHNAEELQDMVKNYLDLSRAERGELQVQMRSFDFRTEVVDPITAHVEGLYQSREISLEVHAPSSLPMQGDPTLLGIALTNYLNNAAKYGRAEGRAVLTVEARQDRLVVDLWNEGEGFTEQERAALFQKFSRLQNQSTRTKKGSGLGLYLTQQAITLHGGKTWAESEPGQWARFAFEVPLVQPHAT